MKGLIPKEKHLYLPYSQRTVSMIYFDASQVFASLLSCPLLNRNENFCFTHIRILLLSLPSNLYMVDANNLVAPTIGIRDVGRSEGVCVEEGHYLFLFRRKDDWVLSWDSMITSAMNPEKQQVMKASTRRTLPTRKMLMGKKVVASNLLKRKMRRKMPTMR
jgi:hypothetical protein